MMSACPKLVVIDNGIAGVCTVEESLKLAPDLYDIAVFGGELHGNYNRILLSPVLTGEKQIDDIMLNTCEWYNQNRIVLHISDLIVAADRPRCTLRSRDGMEMRYNRLLIATGSHSLTLPVPGHLLPSVIIFRDIQDVETMLGVVRSHRHAVVIGSGLLGLEAANGLMRQGMDVTVVHLPDTLMGRQLDKPVTQLLQKALEAKGLRFLLDTHTVKLLGTDRMTVAHFKDGTQIPADFVVMIAGVRPNIELAEVAGLHCKCAIIVGSTLQTYDLRIYAVSECVQHHSATFGLVIPARDQVRVHAAHLVGTRHRRYVQQATATKLKVIGVDSYSIGDFIGGDGVEDIALCDPRCGVYKRLVPKKDRIVDAALCGDVADDPWYSGLTQREIPITSIRQRLLSSRVLCETEAT